MLYVSTRSRTDSFTSYRTLHEDRTPDGGMFVPMRLPVYSEAEILALKNNSFGENVAQILNQFFSTGLTGWDIDFIIGRRPYRIVQMNHRLIVGELWRNLESDYSYTERCIYNKLCNSNSGAPTEWAKVAIRIAVLFGLYGELARQGIKEADIAVTVGDFSLPVAAWYARSIGLPIGIIICGCNENGDVWDLIHRGELNTNFQTIHTELPLLDITQPAAIERLIFGSFGLQETLRYVEASGRHRTYKLTEEELTVLNKGMFAAVVSNRRVRTVIASVYRTNHYIADGYTAVAYGCLQDYRARTGESRPTLLLAERSPVLSADFLTEILDMSKEEIKNQL